MLLAHSGTEGTNFAWIKYWDLAGPLSSIREGKERGGWGRVGQKIFLLYSWVHPSGFAVHGVLQVKLIPKSKLLFFHFLPLGYCVMKKCVSIGKTIGKKMVLLN